MQLDQKTLQRLLSLNDEQLTAVIRSLAENSGLDLSEFQIRQDDINSIRSALAGATEQDLARAAEQMRAFRKGKR